MVISFFKRDGRKLVSFKNVLGFSLVLFFCVVALFTTRVVVLNVTRSVPIGFWVRDFSGVMRGSFVLVPVEVFKEKIPWYPEEYYRQNGFAKKLPFLKAVAGVCGDVIAIHGEGISVNGDLLPLSLPVSRDRRGTKLEAFPLPIVLKEGEIWLTSEAKGGIDSRYFGPIRMDQIKGVYKKFLTW